MLKTFFMLCMLFSSVQTIWSEPLNAQSATRIFEELKKQEGLWEGKSSKGWENRQEVKVIARGSAVMSTSEFVDDAHEGMATMFYLDAGDLYLTHYCEAGNQPTLKAVEESPQGILFEFVRGGNLADRNAGHMDKVLIRFIDKDRYTSQWTWYANGKERWLENIEYKRVR